MRKRQLLEKICFSGSVILFGLALSGTKACQEDYEFAKQSNVTPEPTETPDDVITLTPTVTRTATATAGSATTGTPTATPTATTDATTKLIEAFKAIGTTTALDSKNGESDFINPYAEALKGKPENWLGLAFKEKPAETVIDTDSDGFTDWLEILMSSDPKDQNTTPPTPVTRLKDRLGLDSVQVREKLQAYVQSLPPEMRLDDLDADGLPDYIELTIGSDPNNKDSDSDGILDPKEFELGSDPIKPEAAEKR